MAKRFSISIVRTKDGQPGIWAEAWTFPYVYVDSDVVTGRNRYEIIRDAAVVHGHARISSIEQLSYLDSHATIGQAHILGIEGRDYAPDADTIVGAASISAIEYRERFTISTVAGNTTVSAQENADYVDSKTVIGDGYTFRSNVDQDTVTGTGVPLVDFNDILFEQGEYAEYVDSSAALGTGVTGASQEEHGYYSADTVEGNAQCFATDAVSFFDDSAHTSIAVPIANDSIHAIDSDTVSTVTGVASIDGLDAFDLGLIPNSYAMPFAIDQANYIDANSSTAVASPTADDRFGGLDSSIIAGVSVVSAIDNFYAVDANTVQSTSVVNATELFTQGVAFSETTSNTVNSTSISISKPASTSTGDLLVAVIGKNSASTVITLPSGWVQLTQTNNVVGGMVVAYCIANLSEPSSYTFTSSASSRMNGIILNYKHANTTSVAYVNSVGTGASNFPTAPSVTTTQDNDLIIAAFFQRNNISMTPAAGMIERADVIQSQVSTSVDDQVIYTAGATGARAATAGGGQEWVAYMFAVHRA